MTSAPEPPRTRGKSHQKYPYDEPKDEKKSDGPCESTAVDASSQFRQFTRTLWLRPISLQPDSTVLFEPLVNGCLQGIGTTRAV